MRFSVAGWVEKRLSIRAPESGLMMKRCAIAGFRSAASFGICRAALWILASAEASHDGRPVISAAARSAEYSRVRLTADLDEERGDRRDDRSDEDGDEAERVVVVARAAAEEEREIREHRDRAGDGRGDRHESACRGSSRGRARAPSPRRSPRATASARARWSRRRRRSPDCGRWQRRSAGDCR